MKAVNQEAGQEVARRRAEDREKRLERMQAYRMVRRIEQDLPPLTVDESLLPKPCDQHFVKLNTTPEQLFSQSLASRTKRIQAARELRSQRRASAERKRSAMDHRIEEKRMSVLGRARPSLAAGAPPDCEPDACAREWATVLCLLGFAARARGGLRRAPAAAPVARPAEELEAMVEEARASPQVAMLTAMWQVKLHRRRQHTAATCVVDAMTKWRVAGRFFFACRRFMSDIIKVQRWWRAWSFWHRVVVRKLSQRWELLERGDIAHQVALRMSKAEHQQEQRSSKTRRLALSVDEYCMMDVAGQGERVEFITHELRARRYKLLPVIRLWEEECRRWSQQRQEARIFNEARATVGSDGRADLALLWAPVRPSYLVPQRGRAGALGDKEIVSWIHAARKDPRGWSRIPTKATAAKRRVSNSRRAGRRASLALQVEQKLAAAETLTEQELAQWGADLASMPLLGGRAGVAVAQA